MGAESRLLSARLALGWLVGGEWRWHPLRFALTALAIAVGVALGFAVHLVNGSALASFDGAVRSVNGAAELAVRAVSPLGIDELAYPWIATAPGVADASPVVELRAHSGEQRFTLLGIDLLRAAAVTPSLIGIPAEGSGGSGEAVFDGQALFLSRGALARIGARIGDRVMVGANGHVVPLRIAGTLPALSDDQAIGVIDIAAAQWRFGRLGRIDRIDLKLADRPQALAALPKLLPAAAALESGQSRAIQGDTLSRAYRVNLDMLALVALLTGGFLVYSAQSLSVTRRLRAFALIRTLGLPRGGIVAAVTVEGLIIGVIGSALGLLAGYGLAAGALRLFGGDLGAGYFDDQAVRLVFQPGPAAAFFILGLAAALLGSVLPARAAARAAPAAALKNSGDMIDPRAPVPWRPAALLVLMGAPLALLPAAGGLPLFGFASIALLLAGGIAGVPWLARQTLGWLSRRPARHVPQLLATRHVHGAPGEVATALCGIVASTALMIAMATMVTSFRVAVDGWLGHVLSGDLYIRSAPPGFAPADQARLAATPGVAEMRFSQQIPLTIRPDRPPIILVARPVGREGRDPLLDLIESGPPAPSGSVPVWVSEPASRLYGWRPGAAISLPIAPGQRFAVVGIWRDYARQNGAVIIDTGAYQRLSGDVMRNEAAIMVRDGAVPAQVGRSLAARLPPALAMQTEISEPAALRRFALTLFDRSFAVTYLLEAVAILVGLAGVAATMSAQTVARTREFGMLRHLGVSKRQIIAMLATEGALLGLIGGVAGVLLGLVLSQVLIHVINPQSFHWTMSTHVPIGTLAGVIAALVAAAAGTAMLAGRRATSIDAVLAVREDW